MTDRTTTDPEDSPYRDPAFAPIALFIYRRTDLLDHVLDALEACPEFTASHLYVFSDGPKSISAQSDIDAARALIRARLRPNMTLVEAESNKGLARSISEGVSLLCDRHGRAIVLEDDLVVSPAILTWFNAALDRYAADEAVMQISGHMFEVNALRRRNDGLFLPMTTSWGWATWKRAWAHFDPNALGWEAVLTDKVLRRRFDIGGRYPYAKMLERQMRGEIDSWAVRWYWSVFRAGGLSLFPPQTFVLNCGTDVAATHRSLGSVIRQLLPPRPPNIRQTTAELPPNVEADLPAFQAVGNVIDNGFLKRAIRTITRR